MDREVQREHEQRLAAEGWASLNQVLGVHGLDADHLRALHVHAQAPGPELLDSVMRIKLEQRIRNVVRCLRAGDPVDDIPVLQHIQSLPGATGLSYQNMAELARISALRIRTARSYEAFLGDTPQI